MFKTPELNKKAKSMNNYLMKIYKKNKGQRGMKLSQADKEKNRALAAAPATGPAICCNNPGCPGVPGIVLIGFVLGWKIPKPSATSSNEPPN